MALEMNSNKVDEDTSNCPDCLQMLQQQTPPNHQHLPQSVFNDHHVSQLVQHSSQHSSSGRPSHYEHQQNPFESEEEFNMTYDTRRNHSTNTLYKSTSSSSSASATATITNNTIVTNNTGDLVSVPNNNPCLTPLPLEACDLKSYCATCAVLDLPTNDKYYRSSLSRHSVYPPLFYGQGPPIPDIPWGNCNSNDFPPYPYNPYPQQQPVTSNDYYSTPSSTASTVLPPNGSHSFTENTNQVASSSCAFAFPNNHIITASSSCLVNETLCYDKRTTQSHSEDINNKGEGYMGTSTSAAEDEDDDDSVNLPICISSSSEDSSDSGSFLSQNDEVIVEDVDEQEEEEENVATLTHCQEQERNLKCIICQNPILAECTSPQLSNILENIHDEITAEDLDLSVSSGDIEIGGIEDEVVRDFHPKKQNSPQITINRLAHLLNVPPNFFTSSTSDNSSVENPNSVDIESSIANFCTRCGKLCLIIDSLDKQMRIHSLALKQLFPQSLCNQINHKSSNLALLSTSTCTSNGQDMNNMCGQSNETTVCCGVSKLLACKVTQTESFTETLEESKTEYNNSSEPQVITIALSGSQTNQVADIQEETSVQRKHEKNCGEAHHQDNSETNTTVDFDQKKLISSNVDDDIYPVLQAEESESITSTMIELEEFDTNRTTINCQTCDMLEISRKHYLCDECGMIITSRRSFENHFKRHHNELSCKCEICKKGFANEAALRIHYRIHTKEKPFPCPHCSKSFSTKSNMNAHHEICKDNILGEKNEKRNEFLTTENTSKLQCHTCGISFRLKARLIRHQSKGCKSKTFECSRCLKKFSKRSEMKTHLLVHDHVKPFTCQICHLSFTTKGNAVSHQRTHSTEKRFTCTICSKSFNRKQALQLHYNRHNGIQPFCCDICQRKFFDPSNLQNHKKIHLKNSDVLS